ncbi:hypothetical protein DVA86_03685 [Streptomyces armeniacus]|uniref:Uncharacterized protein n=1 Tax=Streptomyces armeniacus TaxID=83291 RepID=A0A345XJR5_9ACTN|nr:hypothetical protein [Streptomyces armeniacus]AXK31881.1 hypothetical protein DVA86_03685 [Streptomyces armeniacus]
MRSTRHIPYAGSTAADCGGVPDGLPGPRPYAHLHPGDGACLMEAASLLAGGPFTDTPRGTHPALAALARVVNDAVDEDTRRALWPLSATLAHAYPADRAFAPALVADAVREARCVRPYSRVLAVRWAVCARRVRKVRTGAARTDAPAARLSDTLWWRGPGRHHLEHAVRVLLRAPDGTERLTALLRRALAAAGGPAAAAPEPSVCQ